MRAVSLVAFGLTCVLCKQASAQQAPGVPDTPPVVLPGPGAADAPLAPAALPTPPRPAARWYEKLSIRGYTQVRYNSLGHEISSAVGTSKDYVMPQDRSVGGTGGFLIRRARLILAGDVHEHVFVYIQPDFAGASSGTTQNIAAIRDFYADVSLDKAREFRFRIGQSKVPFGWENMQSSGNRLALDRSEAINTGVPGERDLGLFFYYATTRARETFKHLVDSGLKGSGDYGVVALGVYNGQGVNLREANTNRHVVARVAYPFHIGSQILEPGLGGYAGKIRPTLAQGVSAEQADLRDARVHASFVLYPQPFGLQAEYNLGVGPELVGNAKDASSNPTVRERFLHGGYVQAMLRLGPTILFARGQLYRGGRKADENAPSGDVREVEGGVEWHAFKALELTATYAVGERQSLSNPAQTLDGRVLRLQAQFNY